MEQQTLLDFEDEFRNNRARNCYPLMFRYDLLTELGEQGRAYEGMEMVILDEGHFTGQQAIADFREHIINSVSQ